MERSASHQTPDARPVAEKAALLARFRGPVQARDAEVVERWRQLTAAEHARAMIDLANMSEQIVAYTGLRKSADEQFPGFPRAHTAGGGRSSAG
jgi:hypothetical protein